MPRQGYISQSNIIKWFLALVFAVVVFGALALVTYTEIKNEETRKRNIDTWVSQHGPCVTALIGKGIHRCNALASCELKAKQVYPGNRYRYCP